MLSATRANVHPGRLLIGGDWREGSAKFDTINPATGEVLTQVSAASNSEVDEAVTAARRAFDDRSGAWRRMSSSDRGKLIWRLADLLERNIDELAELETNVVQHAQHEETEEFPLIIETRSEQQRAWMGMAVRAVQTLAPTHPHVTAAGSTIAQYVLGPIASLLDHGRDAAKRS